MVWLKADTNTHCIFSLVVKHKQKQYISPVCFKRRNTVFYIYSMLSCQKALELIIHGLLVASKHLKLPEGEHKSIRKL